MWRVASRAADVKRDVRAALALAAGQHRRVLYARRYWKSCVAHTVPFGRAANPHATFEYPWFVMLM
jgi:hypothetical protein